VNATVMARRYKFLTERQVRLNPRFVGLIEH
jgi:hypothetical protein